MDYDICEVRTGSLMLTRFIGLSIVAIFLAGCASTGQKRKEASTYTLDADLSARIKGSGAITLLEHQLIPIDYLHKNPDVHGLLINHYMGTGKTFLGIGMAESFPEHPVLIIGPKFLEAQWMNEIARYGVKDPARYKFVSYDNAPDFVSTADISKHFVVVDEIHNLAKKLRSMNPVDNARYSSAYLKLKTSFKLVGLTGTPVYGDESDLAFIINLVAAKDVMPTNQESFRLEFTELMQGRQFFRGYFLESNLVQYFLPPFLGGFGAAIFGPWGALGFPIGLAAIVGTNWLLDPETYRFRRLDVEKMEPIMTKYISYFKFDESHFKDFPAQSFEIKEVPYNKYQYSFFLHLVEGDLPVKELQRLLLNDNIRRGDDDVKLNSTLIHEQIYSQIGAARDIGNFEFNDEKNQIVEPPKFEAIYARLMKNDEQTVLYSNYFNTGILAFEKFLTRKNFKRPFAIIEPNQSPSEVKDIVANYNDGKIKLLMLHPDITEGISLKGTQYLHLLEPMLNNTVLEQVIGRTRRFQSHSHLPKEKQKVAVTMWQSTSPLWHAQLGVINRANWYERYREISYMSRWGIGVSQVDKKYHRKALNPEEMSYLKLQTLEKNLAEMQRILTSKSIENLY